MQNKLEMGDKVTCPKIGSIEGTSIDPFTRETLYHVVFRAEDGRYISSTDLPIGHLEKSK